MPTVPETVPSLDDLMKKLTGGATTAPTVGVTPPAVAGIVQTPPVSVPTAPASAPEVPTLANLPQVGATKSIGMEPVNTLTANHLGAVATKIEVSLRDCPPIAYPIGGGEDEVKNEYHAVERYMKDCGIIRTENKFEIKWLA